MGVKTLALAYNTWLITGGCGFIGVNLIDQILRRKPEAQIRILDNLSVGSRADLAEVRSFKEIIGNESLGQPSGLELLVGDIKNLESCQQACQGIEVVVHLAANTGVAPSVENPRTDMETNVIGTFNMLEAARQHKIKKFIFASSGAPLGEVQPPIHEEKAPHPVSPYGASKLAGEGYCSAYYRTFGLSTMALRFSNVYGPRSKHKSSVVAKFFKQAIAGETLVIYGDGSQSRDFIYIDDLLEGIFLAVQSPMGGEVFQIASSIETSVSEIAAKIGELLAAKTNLRIRVNHEQPRLGDVKRNVAEISKARSLLGYEPKFNLDLGLEKTFEYFKTTSYKF